MNDGWEEEHENREKYLLYERIHPDNGVHPLPAHPFFIPILPPIRRNRLIMRISIHGDDNARETKA